MLTKCIWPNVREGNSKQLLEDHVHLSEYIVIYNVEECSGICGLDTLSITSSKSFSRLAWQTGSMTVSPLWRSPRQRLWQRLLLCCHCHWRRIGSQIRTPLAILSVAFVRLLLLCYIQEGCGWSMNEVDNQNMWVNPMSWAGHHLCTDRRGHYGFSWVCAVYQVPLVRVRRLPPGNNKNYIL